MRMTAPDKSGDTGYGPWNPGIVSHIPGELRHLATIYRPENVFTDLARAEELRDLTGLDCSELVAFRPERLVLHELLVRVTADFSVPDGSKIEDLGINFRGIVHTLLERYIAPELGAIGAGYDALRREILTVIETELATLFPSAATPSGTLPRSRMTGLRALFARGQQPAPVVNAGNDADTESVMIAAWEAKAQAGDNALAKAACHALARVASALLVRHGRVWGSRDTIAELATDIACNGYGSEEIGRRIEPLLAKAVATERFAQLPRQAQPVVMNTKGASASGKSTLRPRQKTLAGDIGVRWSEFALISPDIWRKQLLDYATLGPAYKYGGAFTGEELQVVDQKLDRYMARKAERGEMTHLLIDRFRFDSFAPESDEAGSNLLTRFGHSIYLFFMITPPESLVERAWQRGLDVGRYKAVDDTLAHGVDAYSGMPQLFFTWAKRTDKHVHFEFLDNSVKLGERPRTVAFGSNHELNVLDVKCLLDIERYRKVNVDATAPEHLYGDREILRPENNAGFLRQCLERFRAVNFADQTTGRIYLQIASGAPAWSDREALDIAIANTETRAAIQATMPTVLEDALPPADGPRYLGDGTRDERYDTVGAWGPSRNGGAE